MYDDRDDFPGWLVVEASFDHKSTAEECGMIKNQLGCSCNASLVILALDMPHISDR
jgi:hypothetical protein